MITPEQIEFHRRLLTDFEFFCRHCVWIEGKEPGSTYKFIFNTAQRFLWAFACRMMAEVGMVRIIVVKGRQQGISTFIEVLLFWLALFVANTKVCIISHEAQSTAALFQKVKFAHKNLPLPIRPELQTANRNELVFPNDSRYIILTAGSEESGRSQTAHHQHQSERAFFPKPEAIDAGAGQIVAATKGSYVFKESTGNGQNHFYQEVNDALAGKGLYRVCFIPWYWQSEYRTKPKHGFIRTDEEERLIEIYGPLGLVDNWQLQWRRDKIVELKSLKKFKQEYPNNLAEAFQNYDDAFYDSDLVQAAINSSYVADWGPIIIGVDPARDGDRTIIAIRRGGELLRIDKHSYMNGVRLAGIITNLINEFDADKVFIDWAEGQGAIDILHASGYRNIVEGVNFQEKADDPLYANKKSEIYHRFADWLADGHPSLPNDPDMMADISCIPCPQPIGNGKLQFPPKRDLRTKTGRSPDILDAITLTFTRFVRGRDNDTAMRGSYRKPQPRASKLTTINNTRGREYGSTTDTSRSGGLSGRRFGRYTSE